MAARAKKAAAKRQIGAPARARAVDAAIRLAGERGWRRIGLADIAAEANLSLSELQAAAPSKYALLEMFLERVDAEMLSALPAKPDPDTPRDNLFASVMARLDVIAPHREGVASILRSAAIDPAAACTIWFATRRSLAWMLEAAGISSAGVAGHARLRGLALVMMSTMRVWIRDRSEDLGPTMAHLDRQLRRAQALDRAVLHPLG